VPAVATTTNGDPVLDAALAGVETIKQIAATDWQSLGFDSAANAATAQLLDDAPAQVDAFMPVVVMPSQSLTTWAPQSEPTTLDTQMTARTVYDSAKLPRAFMLIAGQGDQFRAIQFGRSPLNTQISQARQALAATMHLGPASVSSSRWCQCPPPTATSSG